MTQNPAIRTHEAWDTIYRFMGHRKRVERMENTPWLDRKLVTVEEPHLLNLTTPRVSAFVSPIQHLNSTHGIQAVAWLDGQLIYRMGKVDSTGITEHLFTLAPDGSFRFGDEFTYDMTWRWGPFDHVTSLTKFIGHTYNVKSGKVWYIDDGDNVHVHVRNWRNPTLYWSEDAIRATTWFYLTQNSVGSWEAQVEPEQEGAHHRERALAREYRLARERYERYRRRYYRENNLPDPDKRLNASDIETIDHISQHINLYEPGKARFLRDVTPAC